MDCWIPVSFTLNLADSSRDFTSRLRDKIHRSSYSFLHGFSLYIFLFVKIATSETVYILSSCLPTRAHKPHQFVLFKIVLVFWDGRFSVRIFSYIFLSRRGNKGPIDRLVNEVNVWLTLTNSHLQCRQGRQ